MKTILLVCSDGMSTSFLTNKMNEIVRDENLDLNIFALSETGIENQLSNIDVLLIGPQISYLESKIKERVGGRVPVETINAVDFGRMNAKAIIKQALRLIKVEKE